MLRKLHITDGTSYENPGILAFPNINKNYGKPSKMEQ
jgi:hypothetical protein